MKQIHEPEQILAVMRGFIREPQKQTAEFLYEIKARRGTTWNGQVAKGGLHIVGARPFSLVSSPQTGEHLFDLTNSDSGYTRSIGRIRLEDIESITLLH